MLIKFRAKLDADDGTYRVPTITVNHVVTPCPKWTTREKLVLTGRNMHLVIIDLMKDQGIGVRVFEGTAMEWIDVSRVRADTPGVTVTPYRSGYMADISFEITV